MSQWLRSLGFIQQNLVIQAMLGSAFLLIRAWIRMEARAVFKQEAARALEIAKAGEEKG